MVISLYNRIEDEYGFIVTRLCRVFQHKTQTKNHLFHKICCIPTFIFFILFSIAIIGLSILIRVKGVTYNSHQNFAFVSFISTILLSLMISTITCFKILKNFFNSPSMCILRTLNQINGTKIEAFLLELKHEIDYMADTILTLDAFTHTNTRLVVIIDGLDSCEQNKVLQILEIMHVLFTKEGDPYITILAVDPHVLIKGIEGNLMGEFCSKSGSLNGHEYLRTIIHLPIYLQINLSKAKALSKIAANTTGAPNLRRLNSVS
jgi:ankyrin repeat-rich membrane spanning protein